MGSHGKSISSVFAFGVCAALAACSGAAPGGVGAPPADGGAASVHGGSPALAGGPSGAEGLLPENDFAQAQNVPSTQQSDPGMAGACVIRFLVSVKVTRGGTEVFCRGDARELSFRRAIDITGADADTAAPPQDPVEYGPEVTFLFKTPSDIGDRVVKAPTTCGGDGRWQTDRDALRFFYLPRRLSCDQFAVRAFATWLQGESTFISDTFLGPPVPEEEESTGAVPLSLHIDQGPGRFVPEGVQTILGR